MKLGGCIWGGQHKRLRSRVAVSLGLGNFSLGSLGFLDFDIFYTLKNMEILFV